MVKAGKTVLVKYIYTWLCFQFCTVLAQTFRFDSLAVQGYYLHSTVCRYGYQIRGENLVGGVGYLSGKYVGFEEIIGVVLCEKFYVV